MDKINLSGTFRVECKDKSGNTKWKDDARNLVVSTAIHHTLDILFDSSNAQISPWYIGLVNSPVTSIAAGDVLGSHAGWTENANYTGDRKEYVDVRSGTTVSNTASKASFTVSATGQVISGAFMCSTASGSTGTLLCAATFTGGDKSLDTDDVLEVSYSFSMADDGA